MGQMGQQIWMGHVARPWVATYDPLTDDPLTDDYFKNSFNGIRPIKHVTFLL